MERIIKEIIEDFLKVQNQKIESINVIVNKTSRKVIGLNKKFVIKIDNVDRIKKEFNFCNIYKDEEIYERVIYHDFSKGYIVYEYIEGKEINNIENWEDIVKQLNENTNNYKKYDKGYKDLLYCDDKEWLLFLERKLMENIKYHLPNQQELKILKKSFENLRKFNIDTYVIHGDLGIYNILIPIKDKKIKIIDPYPMAGAVNYDILTFFCSSIKILNYFGVNYIINFFKNEKENLYLFIIVLYMRICIESKYKVHNVSGYIEKLNDIIKMEELM